MKNKTHDPVRRVQPGRFVVRTAGHVSTGLAADDVLRLLGSPEGSDAVVFRIHRVDESGALELVGVSASQLQRQDGLMLKRKDVRSARRVFDAVKTRSQDTAPPCRIEVLFGHLNLPDPVHGIAFLFPSVCGDAVREWLRYVSPEFCDPAECELETAEATIQGFHQVVLREELLAVE